MSDNRISWRIIKGKAFFLLVLAAFAVISILKNLFILVTR